MGDAFWGLKPKPKPTTTSTTTTTTTMQTSPFEISSTTPADFSMNSPGFDASNWSPPKPTKSVKCGLKQAYGLDSTSGTTNLFDSENKKRFVDGNIVFGKK